ncbi:MAG: SLC13 family permease [Methanofollis sp.]|nr:SLC13 family permease [Methanofollis sp.]MDD4255092.1 SLC13 family permease [Methanofollis sp.]
MPFFTHITLVIVGAVFLLIAFRQTLGVRISIWQIMLGGAVAMLLSGSVSPVSALQAIDPDVMIFLFCMFLIGVALEESGYLSTLSTALLGRAKTAGGLIVLLVLFAGIGSALLMNDTLAVIGTPLVLGYAVRYGIRSQALLLALAFAVTTGSAASPIGNPQNLLVATKGGFADPLTAFLIALAPPTVLALLLVCAVLFVAFREEWGKSLDAPAPPACIGDPDLTTLARTSLIVVVALIIAKIVIFAVAPGTDIPLIAIAVAAAVPLLVLSPRRTELVRKVDWATLVFFAALFVVMAGVRESGALTDLMAGAGEAAPSIPMIIAAGIVLSQFISNVPFVALALPILTNAGTGDVGMLALAAGSTIAGNLTIAGAASNVIIVQGAERRGATLDFFGFMKIGLPLTLLQATVYTGWLLLI